MAEPAVGIAVPEEGVDDAVGRGSFELHREQPGLEQPAVTVEELSRSLESGAGHAPKMHGPDDTVLSGFAKSDDDQSAATAR